MCARSCARVLGVTVLVLLMLLSSSCMLASASSVHVEDSLSFVDVTPQPFAFGSAYDVWPPAVGLANASQVEPALLCFLQQLVQPMANCSAFADRWQREALVTAPTPFILRTEGQGTQQLQPDDGSSNSGDGSRPGPARADNDIDADDSALYVWHPCGGLVRFDDLLDLKLDPAVGSMVANDVDGSLVVATSFGAFYCSVDPSAPCAMPSCAFVSAAMGPVARVAGTGTAGLLYACAAEGVFLLNFTSGGSWPAPSISRPAGFPADATQQPCVSIAVQVTTDGAGSESSSVAFATSQWYVHRFLTAAELQAAGAGLANVGAGVWNNYSMQAVISANVTDLAFDSAGQLWAGHALGVDVQTSDPRAPLTWWRLNGYYFGLPSDEVTRVVRGAVPGEMLIGSARGLMRYYADAADQDPYGPLERFYAGPRYAPGSAVRWVCAQSNGDNLTTVAYITDAGIGVLSFDAWSLARKAGHMIAINEKRHDRYGLTSEVDLRQPGDLTTFFNVDSDNDGGNTAYYVMALAYRYGATRDPQDKAMAWRYLDSMEKLTNISGTPGFVARSYGHSGDPIYSGGHWYNSTVPEYAGWMWKSDTSSDEITLHMMTYTVFYDAACDTDAERARVAAIVEGIVQYIVDNGYQLIDPMTGNVTTWGFWNPLRLNTDRWSTEERGLNSMQMLGYLAAAYRMTNNSRWLQCFNTLVAESMYGLNTVTELIAAPVDIAYWDHELSCQARLTLVQNMAKAGLEIPQWVHSSIERFWAWTRRRKAAMFSLSYSVMRKFYAPFPSSYDEAVGARGSSRLRPRPRRHSGSVHARTRPSHGAAANPRSRRDRNGSATAVPSDPLPFSPFDDAGAYPPDLDAIVEEAVSSLKAITLDRIDWAFDNTVRQDVEVNYESPLIGTAELLRVVRPSEARFARWTDDTFQAVSGGASTIEFDTGPWLCYYYMGVYYGLFQ